MGIHVYLQSLSKLERIYRAPGEFKFEQHNVAAHSFKVAQYAQLLATVEEQNGTTIDWKSLYEKALNHDYSEVFIGDIKTPVKYATPELREMLAQVEEGMAKKFIEAEFPPDLLPIYLEKLKEGKDETIEGRILAVADKMDQVYEAYNEIEKGNTENVYREMYKEALLAIRKTDLHCVSYFFKHILAEMLEDNSETTEGIRKITEKILNQ
ncbi:putative hydrolase of HD superfamily [Evansella vedderi]|uniref:Hydrolase of HD superfamily n=1 Tax=Evansella vedderi TaxID=38282 RepID=A0ABT9ZVF0_9BACI|nr:HD domain-containing protein [Evansella vedderi]MDQ0254844.1 putative hydrolase of HD superfamily [Evansella vedderi]